MNTNDIGVNGNSHDELQFMEVAGLKFIKKTAILSRASRLEQSCRMQINSIHRTPGVLDEKKRHGCFSFTMEYVSGFCGSEIPEYCDVRTVGKLKLFFSNYVSKISELNDEDVTEDFQNKLSSMDKEKVDNELYYHALKSLRTFIGDDRIICPVGDYHGDLTLSNIVVSNSTSEIFLIDFLPSYVSTPLLDVAKIEQDLLYKWSYRHKNTKSARVDVALNYLYPTQELKSLSKYARPLRIISLLNTLRIFPYITDEATQKWCNSTLQKELKQL